MKVHIIEFENLLDLLKPDLPAVLKMKVNDYYVYYTGTINAELLVIECFITTDSWKGFFRMRSDGTVDDKGDFGVRIREVKKHKQVETQLRRYVKEQYYPKTKSKKD